MSEIEYCQECNVDSNENKTVQQRNVYDDEFGMVTLYLCDDCYCFDYRFTSGGTRMGFCKIMVKFVKETGALAITYVKEEHEH